MAERTPRPEGKRVVRSTAHQIDSEGEAVQVGWCDRSVPGEPILRSLEPNRWEMDPPWEPVFVWDSYRG